MVYCAREKANGEQVNGDRPGDPCSGCQFGFRILDFLS